MPTYVQCSYFIFGVKKNPQRIHFYILYDMSCLSTTSHRSQLLEQQSSFRVVLFLLQSVKASIPLSDDVYAHPMENNATGMSQSVCGNCTPDLWEKVYKLLWMQNQHFVFLYVLQMY